MSKPEQERVTYWDAGDRLRLERLRKSVPSMTADQRRDWEDRCRRLGVETETRRGGAGGNSVIDCGIDRGYPAPADVAIIARAPGSLEEYVTRRQAEALRDAERLEAAEAASRAAIDAHNTAQSAYDRAVREVRVARAEMRRTAATMQEAGRDLNVFLAWPTDAEFEAMTEESYRRASEAWAARCASGVLSPEQRRITQAEEMAD